MANGNVNPFVSGMQAGQQLVSVPFQQYMQKKRLKSQEKAQAGMSQLQQQKMAQQQPYLDARTQDTIAHIHYLNALAQGKGQGTAFTPPVLIQQSGQAPYYANQNQQDVPTQTPNQIPAQTPTAYPTPNQQSIPNQTPVQTPVPAPQASPSAIPAPAPPGASAMIPPAQAPRQMPIQASSQGQQHISQGMPTIPSPQAGSNLSSSMAMSPNVLSNTPNLQQGISYNPFSVGSRTRRGAQIFAQDPDTHQIWSGSSPTTKTQTMQQIRAGAVAELHKAYPVIEQAYNDYSGFPGVRWGTVMHDITLDKMGNKAARERLINLAVANRMKPDLSMAVTRGLTGTAGDEKSRASVALSQYAGLPGDVSYFPRDVQIEANKRYNEIVPLLSQASQISAMSGSYIGLPPTTTLEGGVPRPTYQRDLPPSSASSQPSIPAPVTQTPSDTALKIPSFTNKNDFLKWYHGLPPATQQQVHQQLGS